MMLFIIFLMILFEIFVYFNKYLNLFAKKNFIRKYLVENMSFFKIFCSFSFFFKYIFNLICILSSRFLINIIFIL